MTSLPVSPWTLLIWAVVLIALIVADALLPPVTGGEWPAPPEHRDAL